MARWLQWSRDFSAAECERGIASIGYFDIASMEPRLFSRGMADASLCAAVVRIASMEPRLFSRGMSVLATPTRVRCLEGVCEGRGSGLAVLVQRSWECSHKMKRSRDLPFRERWPGFRAHLAARSQNEKPNCQRSSHA